MNYKLLWRCVYIFLLSWDLEGVSYRNGNHDFVIFQFNCTHMQLVLCPFLGLYRLKCCLGLFS